MFSLDKIVQESIAKANITNGIIRVPIGDSHIKITLSNNLIDSVDLIRKPENVHEAAVKDATKIIWKGKVSYNGNISKNTVQRFLQVLFSLDALNPILFTFILIEPCIASDGNPDNNKIKVQLGHTISNTEGIRKVILENSGILGIFVCTFSEYLYSEKGITVRILTNPQIKVYLK